MQKFAHEGKIAPTGALSLEVKKNAVSSPHIVHDEPTVADILKKATDMPGVVGYERVTPEKGKVQFVLIYEDGSRIGVIADTKKEAAEKLVAKAQAFNRLEAK